MGMTGPALICIDWGTSSFRAWLVGPSGAPLDEVSAPAGILAVPDGDFDAAFTSLIGGWLGESSPLPIIASGMITSRNGWCETPYLRLPASAAELAANLTRFVTRSGAAIHFVPGLTWTNPQGIPDVMRGEEAELVGHIADSSEGGGLFVMPGTHSKWVTAGGGFIQTFQTYMTGEFYAVLRQHSILGRLVKDSPFRRGSFLKGVEVALNSSPSLLSVAFSARTLALSGALVGEDVGDYLSGLLIGSEVKSAQANNGGGLPIILIGRGDLVERYALAMPVFGLAIREAPQGMARQGQMEIARRAGLI
jgi:2-dehydro-3-deoxygalactonokinase